MADSTLTPIEAERKAAVRKLAEIYLQGGHSLYDDLARDGSTAYSGQDWEEFLVVMNKVHASIGKVIARITGIA